MHLNTTKLLSTDKLQTGARYAKIHLASDQTHGQTKTINWLCRRIPSNLTEKVKKGGEEGLTCRSMNVDATGSTGSD